MPAAAPGPAGRRGAPSSSRVRSGPDCADLRRSRAERADIVGELLYFSSRGQGVAVRGQRGPELRIAGDRGVADSVNGGEEVPDTDGVQPAPLSGSEHP